MRTVNALVALTLIGGCAKDIKPTGPVVTPYEYGRDFSAARFSGAKYIGAPLTTMPVLPFMGFGTAFDIDIVVGLKDDKWDMIELARVQRPDQSQPMWLVLESRAGTKEQSIVANVEDINTWMPELPLARKSGGLDVEDRTTSDGLDIRVKYDNIDNQPVELVFQGSPPDKLSRKRNGNTMGHSSNDLLAVLDVSSMESLFKADVMIDDQNVRSRKVGAILPMQFALTQTQGGVARGEFWQRPTSTVAFDKDAEFATATKWEPPAPPAPPPVIPDALNMPAEDVALLPIEEWQALSSKASKKALDAQETKLEVCLVPATIADPDYMGLVQGAFHVKNGKPWQITILEGSTGNELVWGCVQETIAGWEFDEALDGSIGVTLGKFPAGYEAQNDAEKAWIADNPLPEPEEAPEEKPEEDDLPEEEGEDDLLDGEGDDLLGEMADPADAVLMAFETIHKMPDGTNILQDWDVKQSGDRVWITQDSGLRKMSYEFLVFGEALELRSIRVENWGQSRPAFAMTFSPAIPDLARPFSGKVESQFVMDVGGQTGHATGKVVSESADNGAKVTITPSAPDWAASRGMISQIEIKDGTPKVLVRMVN